MLNIIFTKDVYYSKRPSLLKHDVTYNLYKLFLTNAAY